jgi:two-component system CheB/CheR fusion protein
MLTPHYIVAIGGSAGSLEALTVFFDHTPIDHVSYVIVRHLPEDYHSQLKAILKQHSKLRLVNVTSPTKLQNNTVYIGPNDKDLIVENNVLQLVEKNAKGPNLCVDRFFKSLSSQPIGKRVIAVVLSGSGSDGTAGIRFIKEAGGTVIAQDPLSCTFKYMPQHAIESGYVDHIAAPAQIPTIIHQYIKSS